VRYRLTTEHADYLVDGDEKWFIRHPNGLDGTLKRHGDGSRVPFEEAYIPQVGGVAWFTHLIHHEYGEQLKLRETEIVTDIERLESV